MNSNDQNDSFIQITNLHKKLGSTHILKGISLNIKKGDTVSVIGPSGCGKSTFLRCINLLEPPTSGQICIGGKDITAPGVNVNEVRQKVGMVFQHFNLFHHLTVLDNITLAPRWLQHIPRKEAEERAMELLTMFNLADKFNAYPVQLSGGQKQRIAMARALATNPEVLLFDEPTSALDPEMVSEVLYAVMRLSYEGMTMIIVTHEMRFARDASDRIIFIDEGVVKEDGPPQEVIMHPKDKRLTLFLNEFLSD